MSMGGGSSGGSSGGMVVGGPTPEAAKIAGQYQSNAATQASQAYSDAVNSAINQMNQMYQTSRNDVQPYRTEGVQALNQLNQYLGLNPYNPGAAPTAPTKSVVSQDDIMNYIHSHIDPGNYSYTGVGASLVPGGGSAYGTQNGTYVGSDGNTYISPYSTPDLSMVAQYNLPQNATKIQAAVRDYLQKPLDTTYNTAMAGYNQDLNEYNQNLDMYNQYSAAGPLTSAQISDKISNLPGYQSQLNQGIDAIQKSGSAAGYLGSGRLLKELNSYGQNTLSTFYGNELNRLSQLAGSGQQAATQSGQNALQTGQTNASLLNNLGDTQANSALSSGNALAQAILAANQQYKIIGGGSSGGGGGGLGGLGDLLGGGASLIKAFSSETLKDKIKTPSTEDILNRVNALKIDQWKYKGIDQEHIGPYAEQFNELFHVGDGQSINIIDMFGVLFASVKELSSQVNTLQEKLNAKL